MKTGYILDGPPKTVNKITKLAENIADLYATLQSTWGDLAKIIDLNIEDNPPFESWIDEWWDTHETHADDLMRWIAERGDHQAKRKKLEDLKRQILPLMKDLDIDSITLDDE